MRALPLAIIATIAILMGYLWFQPECRGGGIAASEQECVSIPGFDRQFCARAFARPEDAIFRAGNVFATQSDCQLRHPVCIAYPGVHGWTPQPTGYCLAREQGSAQFSMTPLYGPRKSLGAAR